jgi:protein O-GlcNAc transferase
MTSWPEYALRVEALQRADSRLAANPDDVEAHFDRGRLLSELGRPEEARAAYFEVIKRSPAHFGALNTLGGVLHAGGFRTAARSAYAEAVARILDAARRMLVERVSQHPVNEICAD